MRYLVSHRVKRIYASQDELIQDWRGLRQRARAEAKWLHSWWSAPSERLYCEWEAPSPDALQACFLPAELEMAPIEAIDEVVAIDPAWLDETEGWPGPDAAPAGA